MKQLTDDLQDRVIELLVTSLHFTPSHEPNIAIDAQAAILELRALPDVPIAQPVPEVNAMLVEALEQAHDMVDHWGCYASDYFQQKHDLAGDKAKIKEALTAAKQAQPEPDLNKLLVDKLVSMVDYYLLGFEAAERAHGIKQAQPEPFTPDWSQDSAAAESIREHQAICNLLLKEMRHIADISTGQVKRVAEQALEAVKQAQPDRRPA